MSSLFLFHFSKRETKQRFFSNFVQCSFFSRKNQKRVYILFLFKKKQNQKKILYPLLPLLHKRGQPLLLVALTLRYARTIKGPAWVFYIINKHGVKWTQKVGLLFCIYIHITFGCLCTPFYRSIFYHLFQYLLGGYSSISYGGIGAFRKRRARYSNKWLEALGGTRNEEGGTRREERGGRNDIKMKNTKTPNILPYNA